MFYETKLSQIKLLLSAFLLGYLANSFASPGDSLVISGDLVNFRTAPSTNSAISTKLPRGTRLIEIQRQGEWVEVKTGREDIKTGWVHGSLLYSARETTKADGQYAAPSLNLFNKFKPLFEKQKENIKNQAGDNYFANARFVNESTIGVIATEAWLVSASEERQTALGKVLDIWNKVNPDANAIIVRVYDLLGEQHMMMILR